MTSTLCPASASATARLHEVSVLPVPPFGPSTQISRPSSLTGLPSLLARSAGDRLAHREPELLLRLGEERHVGGPGLESPPEEPVRRRRREHDDRDVRRCPVRVVDDLERPVVLAALAGHEDYVDLAALERAHGVVDAVGHADELEGGIVGQGPLDVEDVEPLDCDQCADAAFHGPTYCCPLICARSSALVMALLRRFFASPAGRRRNQSVPESAARPSSGRALRPRGGSPAALPRRARITRTFGASRPRMVPPADRSRSRCPPGRRSRRSRRGRVRRRPGSPPRAASR